MILHLLLPALLSFGLQAHASPIHERCKAVPGSPSWPSAEDWSALNASLSGQLIRPTPPGAACHPDQPSYNSATCAFVAAQWANSSFHAADPVSVDYNDDSCPPSALFPCFTNGSAAYVVNASSGAHVQAGIRFARTHGIRLIVKGTGHDFPGRSAAPDALSIWTHHLRGFDHHPAFVPHGCRGCAPSVAVTIAAGQAGFCWKRQW